MTFDTHRAALDRYGLQPQMIQTIEECAELTEALCHHMRGRQSDVIGELADVTIMVRQMTLAFGEEEVARAVEMKLERLRLRMAA